LTNKPTAPSLSFRGDGPPMVVGWLSEHWTCRPVVRLALQ
jgi:hypothetical protein